MSQLVLSFLKAYIFSSLNHYNQFFRHRFFNVSIGIISSLGIHFLNGLIGIISSLGKDFWNVSIGIIISLGIDFLNGSIGIIRALAH